MSETFDRFVYDPAYPVPTLGGNLCCDAQHFPQGPFDQRANESRADVLVYSTPALQQDVEVTGPVTVDLYVGSSVVDTDFTAKLVDVWPNGFAQNLTDSIARVRYRESPEKVTFMTPGDTYKLKLDLWSTSNLFKAGHKIRVDISSSNFPGFDRNLNTGENPATSTRMVKATNTIYHDREHSQRLSCPSGDRIDSYLGAKASVTHQGSRHLYHRVRDRIKTGSIGASFSNSWRHT